MTQPIYETNKHCTDCGCDRVYMNPNPTCYACGAPFPAAGLNLIRQWEPPHVSLVQEELDQCMWFEEEHERIRTQVQEAVLRGDRKEYWRLVNKLRHIS